jgi:hypothetical protein
MRSRQTFLLLSECAARVRCEIGGELHMQSRACDRCLDFEHARAHAYLSASICG